MFITFSAVGSGIPQDLLGGTFTKVVGAGLGVNVDAEHGVNVGAELGVDVDEEHGIVILESGIGVASSGCIGFPREVDGSAKGGECTCAYCSG